MEKKNTKETFENLLSLINGTNNQIQYFVDTMRQFLALHLEGVIELINTPEIQMQLYHGKAGTFNHPMYYELFSDGFNTNILQKNWKIVRNYLWARRPVESSRQEKYNQLLKAQTAEAYFPVCCGAYAEIEGILREEFVFKNADAMKEFYAKPSDDNKGRKQTIATRTHNLTTLADQKNWKIDLKSSLEDILIESGNIFTVEFLYQLKKGFKDFDPLDLINGEDLIGRHIYNHGWAKKAGFIDGLNSLLLLDMAINIAPSIRRDPSNATSTSRPTSTRNTGAC